jgi:hypothetical protein
VIEPVAAPLCKMSLAKNWFRQGFLRPGFSASPEEVAVLSPRPAESSFTGESPSEERLSSYVVTSLPEFVLASPMMSLTKTIALALPVVPSTILVALEVAQCLPEMIDTGSVLLGCSQIVPETSLTPVPMGSTQIVPETILTSTEAALVILSSPELTQTVPVGLSISPEPFGLVFSEGSKSAPDLAVPEAQLLVNGLTEGQAWFLGWLRDGTRSHDCFEVQTRRKNEVALPPVCSVELPKLKVALEARIRDVNRENMVRSFVLSVAASLEDGSPEVAARVLVVPPTASAGAGCITPPDVPVGRENFFLFPPVLEDAPMFVGLAKRSFGSKTTPRREAIQLYRITRRELEHRISTACSVYFGGKDWG